METFVSTQEQDLSTLDISTLTTDDPEALEAQILGTPAEVKPEVKEEKPEDKPEDKTDDKPDEGKKPDEGPGNVRKALTEARAMARKAEAEREAREKEIAELKQARDDLEAKVKAAAEKPAETKTDPQAEFEMVIKAVEEDAPDLAKAMRAQAELAAELAKAQKAEIASLKEVVGKQQEQISEVVKRDHDSEVEQQKALEGEVDKAIEATPKLAYLRDLKDSDKAAGEMWQAAIVEDNVLKERGKWQKASFTERFAEAVRRVEVDYGEIKLPPEYLTKADLEARAKKAAGEAKDTRPSTLSDLPGGTPPAPDALGAIENADPSSILNSLMGMGDVDKGIEDLLRKAG